MSYEQIRNYVKREARWACLLALHNYQSGLSRQTLAHIFEEMRYTGIDLDSIMADLVKRGCCNPDKSVAFWTITPMGIDIVEGNIECPESIARRAENLRQPKSISQPPETIEPPRELEVFYGGKKIFSINFDT
jgi:hypothetical protein